MPYESDAQRRYFHAALKRGAIKPSFVREFDEASKGLRLPEHVQRQARSGQLSPSRSRSDFADALRRQRRM